MGVMKLHLFQDITYYGFTKPRSWADYNASLQAYSSLDPRIPDELSCGEFISAGSWDHGLKASFDAYVPVFFGITYPEDQPPAGLHTYVLQAGDYLFSQFSDASVQGIYDAASHACAVLHAKKWTPSASMLLLRGIREGSNWKLQILIPLI